mgnify:CR=1 FL=1
MNTFLPCGDFAKVASILDPGRLSRQISEACTVAKTLWAYGKLVEMCERSLPWGVTFPPAVTLWVSDRGEILLPELQEYQRCMNVEWKRHHDGQAHESFLRFNWERLTVGLPKPRPLVWPMEVHGSHRSKLLGKDCGYYKRAFERAGIPAARPGQSYVWDNPRVMT